MSIVESESLYYRVFTPEKPQAHRHPIVFLHGLMGFSANWGKIWPKFQTEHSILVLDQRGHGKSFKPDGYSPTDYANDLKDLLDKLGWSNAHIVGHSMGGRVALRLCSLFPHLAKSLVMEDSGTNANPDRINWIQNLLGSIPTPFSHREMAKTFFSERFKNEPMLGSFLHANLEMKTDGTFDWRFHKPGMIETICKGRAVEANLEFKQLNIPILLVRGGRSVEFPEAEAKSMQALNTHSELATIPDAGHFVHAEKPDEFCQILKTFFDRIE